MTAIIDRVWLNRFIRDGADLKTARESALLRAGVLVAILMVCATLLWMGRLRSGRVPAHPFGRGPAEFPATSERLAGGDFIPVHVDVGLVSDFYEHGFEHAPPRDPSGCMQRREVYYAAPADPFDLIELRANAGNAADIAAARELARWRRRWENDIADDRMSRASLEAAMMRSSLAWNKLMDMGRAFAWLDGDETAATCYRVGFAKASAALDAKSMGELEQQQLIHALDQTKALWRLKEYSALETRFRLACRCTAPLSVEHRRSQYLLGDALFYQHRYREAADAFLEAQNEHEQIGDLNSLDPGDVPEMAWALGLSTFYAERYPESIPYWQVVAHSNDAERRMYALRYIVDAAGRSNRIADAQAALSTLYREGKHN